MSVLGYLWSALAQVLTVLVIGFVIYVLRELVSKKRVRLKLFPQYLGLQPAHGQLDKKFMLILIVFVAFGFSSTLLQFRYSATLHGLLVSDHSPYGKILNRETGMTAVFLGAIYSYIQAAGSEELLFRGLIGKRLFSAFGNAKGNFIQALIFWLMHLAIFRLVTGKWISLLQLMAFATSFGMGLVLGYVNFRKEGQSILPSWLLHGSANFSTFLALYLLRK